MSYISGGTTIRGDINQALVEAPNGDTGLIGAEIFGHSALRPPSRLTALFSLPP